MLNNEYPIWPYGSSLPVLGRKIVNSEFSNCWLSGKYSILLEW